jgi:hypothetical protein
MGFAFALDDGVDDKQRNAKPTTIEALPLTCYKRSMDKTIRKYGDLDEMKADEYRYWQSRPTHERVAAVWELTEEGYKLKGFKPDAFRLQRTLVHFERAPR